MFIHLFGRSVDIAGIGLRFHRNIFLNPLNPTVGVLIVDFTLLAAYSLIEERAIGGESFVGNARTHNTVDISCGVAPGRNHFRIKIAEHFGSNVANVLCAERVKECNCKFFVFY